MMYGHPQQMYGYYSQAQMVVPPSQVEGEHNKDGQDGHF